MGLRSARKIVTPELSRRDNDEGVVQTKETSPAAKVAMKIARGEATPPLKWRSVCDMTITIMRRDRERVLWPR